MEPMKYWKVKLGDRKIEMGVEVGDEATAKHFCEQIGGRNREPLPLRDGYYLVGNLNNGDLVELTGLNNRNIDHAIPIGWANWYESEHGHRPQAVMNYNEKGHEEPLFYVKIMEMIGDRVIKAIEEGKFVAFTGTLKHMSNIVDWVPVEGVPQ